MESVPNAATQKGGIRVTTRKPATTPLTSKRLRNVGTHICDANGDIGVFSPHHNEPRVYQRSASNRLTPSGVRSIPIGYLIQREEKRRFEAGMTAPAGLRPKSTSVDTRPGLARSNSDQHGPHVLRLQSSSTIGSRHRDPIFPAYKNQGYRCPYGNGQGPRDARVGI